MLEQAEVVAAPEGLEFKPAGGLLTSRRPYYFFNDVLWDGHFFYRSAAIKALNGAINQGMIDTADDIAELLKILEAQTSSGKR